MIRSLGHPGSMRPKGPSRKNDLCRDLRDSSEYLVYNLLLLHHHRVFSDGTEIQPFLRPVKWYLWFVSRKRRCQAAPTWLVVFPGIGVDCDATVLTPARHGAAIIQPARNQPILEGLTRSLRLGLFCDVQYTLTRCGCSASMISVH